MVVRHEKQARLPVQQLLVLSICRIAEPIAFSAVNPYLPEMIESFDVSHDKVAKWAGITSAAFSLCQCFTSFSWQALSDRFGRKTAVLCSLTCVMMSTLLFGFSKSLVWAVVARGLSGASNGNIGIMRTMVAELVTERVLQPRAFSVMPLVWCVGSAFGPIIGGTLASPARRFPTLFGQSEFFKNFPFLLPNLVAAGMFVLGIVVGILFLKETLETKKHHRDHGLVVGEFLVASCTGKRKTSSWLESEERSSSLLEPDLKSTPAKPKDRVSYREVLTFQSQANMLVYVLLSLHAVASDQLVAVFLHLPQQDHSSNNPDVHLPFKFAGGFGLDSSQIGLIYTFHGIFTILNQLIVFPPLATRYGILPCLHTSTLLYPLTYLLTPFTVLLPAGPPRITALLSCLFLKGLADVFTYPCSTITLTNSATSIKALGVLNAMAVSVSAVARAGGPAAAGAFFSWSWDKGYVGLTWWALAGVAACGHAATWLLRDVDGLSGGKDGESTGEEEELGLLDAVDDGGVGGHVNSSGAAFKDAHDAHGFEAYNDNEHEDDHDMKHGTQSIPTDQAKSTGWSVVDPAPVAIPASGLSSSLAVVGGGGQMPGGPPRLRSPVGR